MDRAYLAHSANIKKENYKLGFEPEFIGLDLYSCVHGFQPHRTIGVAVFQRFLCTGHGTRLDLFSVRRS